MEANNVRPINSDLQARMASAVAARNDRPTAQLDRMVADAHATIAAASENIGTVEAGLAVLLEAQADAFTKADNLDYEEIKQLRVRIDETEERRKDRRREHEEKVATAKQETARQVDALARMRTAQQAVVATLAKDITPAAPAEKPFKGRSIQRRG